MFAAGAPAPGCSLSVQRLGRGVDGVDGLAGAFDVALSPDDAYVLVAGNAIAVFTRS